MELGMVHGKRSQRQQPSHTEYPVSPCDLINTGKKRQATFLGASCTWIFAGSASRVVKRLKAAIVWDSIPDRHLDSNFDEDADTPFTLRGMITHATLHQDSGRTNL
ncbi:hypothetical protein E4U17_002405 [Claviceps sp. LM77 group G4]|nr:hypothetical protein E4U17_002405 [Claviceps sp. LM77 group G4]KAG6077308.1 hypothetical protein E4U33_001335 [Claviceps sp. LM78 group G4]KAG6083188.1 hypothetical protein E4U16_004783 [Claviceps sp. LM84 group G4]